jgi:glutamyl-tRNA synthetase
VRLYVPDEVINFQDGVFGRQECNLADHCGDFVLRRADGAWAYQLAVVVDDAAMGVTEVVRGCDLLLSTAQQLYLYRLLGVPAPAYAHVPLLCNAAGQRLSKRDASMSMDELRKHYSPERLIGRLAFLAGLVADASPRSAESLIGSFEIRGIPAVSALTV